MSGALCANKDQANPGPIPRSDSALCWPKVCKRQAPAERSAGGTDQIVLLLHC